MRRIRVAAVYSYLCMGGDESRLLQFLAACDRHAIEPLVISGMTPTAASEQLNGAMLERVRALDVEVLTLGVPADHDARLRGKVSPAAQGRAFLSMVRRLQSTLRAREIDVVDGRVNMGTAIGALAGRMAGVRGIVSTNYELTRFHPPGWNLLGQSAYSLVDALVCDSQRCLDDMLAWMWRPPRGVCIPNGIRVPEAQRSAVEMRRELKLPDDAVVVGQVARIQRIKGQDLLLRAMAPLLRERPKLYVLLCGYRQQAHQYQQELDEILASEGIGQRVRMVSYPGPIGDIWGVIDIHAHPTRQDSSPIAILEGMALGRPAVTTTIGGIPELVSDGETGRVVAPEDVAALGAALRGLLDDPRTAAALGQAAKARYLARHQPAAMARATEALYASVFEGR